MNRISMIKEQIESVSTMTKKLVMSVDENDWKVTPEVIASNINWQVGHILLAKYFHAITCVLGRQLAVKEQLPLKDYVEWYTMGSNPGAEMNSKPSKTKLMADLSFIDAMALDTLDKITEEDLLAPPEEKNPMAVTKYEALMWSFKHQMWHNGQIAMIKRVLKRNL